MIARRMIPWLAAVASVAVVVGCESDTSAPAQPSDAALELSNANAQLQFEQGRPALAAASYADALDRARQMDDPVAVTVTAYNLAIARAATADYPAALAALDEAGHEVARTTLDPTDLLLVRARVELLSGDLTAACRAADAALAEPRSKPTPDRQAQAHVTKGLAACRRNDIAGATHELDAARALLAGHDAPAVEAMVAGLTGDVASLSRDHAKAAAAFDRQAELARTAGDYHTIDRALAKAGRAYVAAGRPDVGADRLYRAARAAVGGNDRDATSLVTAAATAARAANDPALIRLTDLLSARLTAVTRPTP
jgi:tetratricopeptide (TPR) repeat protein